MNHPPSPQADSSPDIKITRWNLRRLDSLIASHSDEWSWRAVEYLARELMRSTVVDERDIPANTVTMRSRVEFHAQGIGVRQVATLVYPGENGLYNDAISVLTPIGAALIGLTEGQSTCYAARDAKPATISATKVLYQPEASRRVRLS